jgi:hypothetical protein
LAALLSFLAAPIAAQVGLWSIGAGFAAALKEP